MSAKYQPAETDSELASAVSTINAALSGKQDASTAATDSELAAAVAAHEADTTNVHGLTDTALLVASSDVDTVRVLTQAAYSAIGTPDSRTLYVVSG